jgi:lysozyme
MKLTYITPLAVALAMATAYPIIGDNVNCRSGPGTSYSVVRTYPRGHNVNLTCQTEGTDVFGITIWDKTTDGCYVSDYYVETNVNGYVTSKCNIQGGGNCPAVKSNQATVEIIAGFEGFESDICKDAPPK